MNAFERNNDGPRIAENAADAVEGNESGEAVEVAESSEIGHVGIVTDFRKPEKAKIATNSKEFGRSPAKIHPLKNAKPLFSQRSVLCSYCRKNAVSCSWSARAMTVS